MIVQASKVNWSEVGVGSVRIEVLLSQTIGQGFSQPMIVNHVGVAIKYLSPDDQNDLVTLAANHFHIQLPWSS